MPPCATEIESFSSSPYLLSAPLLLGSGGHDDDDDYDIWKFIYKLVHAVDELDDRVTDLEKCDCVGFLDPVCGEDGNTYVNACEAECREVAVESEGECVLAVCGGDTGLTCESSSFCETEAGSCDDTSAIGRCEEMPGLCTELWEPVCGCDGDTYTNDCKRRAEGVGLDREGECEVEPVECTSDEACADDQFCASKPGSCGGPGLCAPIPNACPQTDAEVCGCDGITYGNSCEAAVSGVSVAHEGACREIICGIGDDLGCPDGLVCLTKPGVCEEGPSGVCVKLPLPDQCPSVTKPVCSCEGDTYDNACLALADGAPIAGPGACGESPTICFGPDSCGEGEYCSTADGFCSDAGECQLLPEICPDILAPVCGCDGKTYDSACLANAAGASVASEGACRDADFCGGLEQRTCFEDDVCLFLPGSCKLPVGLCVDAPKDCPDHAKPVCGCDGNSYPNFCIATQQGVPVASAGLCKSDERDGKVEICHTRGRREKTLEVAMPAVSAHIGHGDRIGSCEDDD